MARPTFDIEAPATALADWALGLRVDDLPDEVIAAAKASLLDTLGAGLCGRDTVEGDIVHAEALRRFRSGDAAVWGRATRLVPEGAALVNGTQAHALELDDYHPLAKLHPAVVITPAALAVADDDTTGDELLAAFLAGYEVMVRVSIAASSAAARRRGWHLTGMIGTIGAAVACARLTGADREGLVNAIGIAASCSAGIFAFSREGSMTKPLHAGRAAMAGIEAAHLAAAGFTGPTHALDADDGGLLGAISGVAEPAKLTAGLGEAPHTILGAAIKPFPACGSNHSSINAALDLRAEYAVDPAEIEAVVAGNSDVVRLQCGFEYTGEGGPLEARMSLGYCVAVALIDGEVGLGQFNEERRHDAAVVDLARRVTVAIDPEVDAIYPRAFPARLTLRLRDGRTLERYVAAPEGSPDRPLSLARVQQKFRQTSANALSAEEQETVVAIVDRLGDFSVADLRNAVAAGDRCGA